MYRLGLSILDSNHLNLHNEVPPLLKHVDFLHIDVMDNHFVDGLSFSTSMIRDISKEYKIPLDCHLMVKRPETLLKFFKNIRMSITFHIETTDFPFWMVNTIKNEGHEVGIALNPSTPIPSISLLNEVDRVVIMSVEPGRGGQKFLLENTSYKLKRIENLSSIKAIQIDGGVNPNSAQHIKNYNVSELVVGSFIFGRNSLNSRLDAIKEIRNALLQ